MRARLFILALPIVLLLAMAGVAPALAGGTQPVPPTQEKCLVCHENLYFLHDTGKYFCLRESPMACTDCHGGDPTALTRDAAHAGRNPHPIVNQDIHKCAECHPAQSSARAAYFEKVAGIEPVLIASSYQPSIPADAPLLPETVEPASNDWTFLLNWLPAAALSVLAFASYLIYRLTHPKEI